MFNNVAIAAHQLINKEKIKRITIIDLDSHHGNGTQEIFFNTPLVLYISLHQNENFYPWSGSIEEIGEGDGEGFNINIPLSKYSGNIEYITAFKKIIEPVIDNYNPEFIIVSLGFDAHKDDPYSDLKLTTNGYLTLLYHIKKLSDKYCNGRLMLCLEGGYNTDVLRKISVKLIELLINKRKFIFIKNFKKKKISNNFMKNIEELKKILSFYWSI